MARPGSCLTPSTAPGSFLGNDSPVSPANAAAAPAAATGLSSPGPLSPPQQQQQQQQQQPIVFQDLVLILDAPALPPPPWKLPNLPEEVDVDVSYSFYRTFAHDAPLNLRTYEARMYVLQLDVQNNTTSSSLVCAFRRVFGQEEEEKNVLCPSCANATKTPRTGSKVEEKAWRNFTLIVFCFSWVEVQH